MDPKFLKHSTERLLKQAFPTKHTDLFALLCYQVEYKTTTIESRYKYPILTEVDLGVTVNLIDPNAYHFYEEADMPQMHPTDSFLAHLQVDPPGTKKAKKALRLLF